MPGPGRGWGQGPRRDPPRGAQVDLCCRRGWGTGKACHWRRQLGDRAPGGPESSSRSWRQRVGTGGLGWSPWRPFQGCSEQRSCRQHGTARSSRSDQAETGDGLRRGGGAGPAVQEHPHSWALAGTARQVAPPSVWIC